MSTTFITSLPHYTPAAGKGLPFDHMLGTFDNTLALKQGDQPLDYLVGSQNTLTDTGTVNDYNPNSGASGVENRWNGASGLTVNGLVFHGAGDIRIFHNVTAAQVLTFADENTGSAAANRFTLSFTLTVGPGGTVAFVYDGTTSRWRVLFVNLYRKGTFNPTVGGSTSQSGQVYSTQVGSYVREKDKVTFYLQVVLSTLGTITGTVRIKGLPYPVSSPGVNTQVATVFWNALSVAKVAVVGILVGGLSELELEGAGAAATGLGTLVQADLSNTSQFIISGSYFTTP